MWCRGCCRRGYPVLVVDDGSRVPATALLADVAGDLHVLRHATNRGKGAALCTGSRGTRNGFTHVISLDADGQHLPEDVPTLAKAVSENTPTKIIVGNRFDPRKIRA